MKRRKVLSVEEEIERALLDGDRQSLEGILELSDPRATEYAIEYAVDHCIPSILDDILSSYSYPREKYINLIYRSLSLGRVDILNVLSKYGKLDGRFQISSDIMYEMSKYSTLSIKLDLELAKYLHSYGVKFSDDYVRRTIEHYDSDLLEYLHNIGAYFSEDNMKLLREIAFRALDGEARMNTLNGTVAYKC